MNGFTDSSSASQAVVQLVTYSPCGAVKLREHWQCLMAERSRNMATTKQTGVTPIERLSGTVKGKRFRVVLDDIHIGDKWDKQAPLMLERDGIGKYSIDDGVPSFEFKDARKSTILFKLTSDPIIEVVEFLEKGAQE